MSTDMSMIESEKYAYLAGLVDGDGHICYKVYGGGKYRYPLLEIISKDKKFLEAIGEEFGDGKYNIRCGDRSWKLAFGLPKSRELLRKIKRYSVLKQSDIECVLSGCEIVRKRNPYKEVWKNMSGVEKEMYLAGLMDAEGSICLVKSGNRYLKSVKISQCNEEFLEMLSAEYGGAVSKNEWRIPLRSLDKMEVFRENIRNENKRKRLMYLYEMRKHNYEIRSGKFGAKILDEIYKRFKMENDKYYKRLEIEYNGE